MARPKAVSMLHEGKRVKAMCSAEGLIVLGENGKLRLYDPPHHICHGKSNGCCCSRCVKPAKGVSDVSKWTRARSLPSINTAPKRCECDRPINNDGTCLSCGKPIGQLRQAA